MKGDVGWLLCLLLSWGILVNGRIAKKIRNIVYGDTLSPRHREETDLVNPHKPSTFVRSAGVMRREYQKAKRFYYTTRRGW